MYNIVDLILILTYNIIFTYNLKLIFFSGWIYVKAQIADSNQSNIKDHKLACMLITKHQSGNIKCIKKLIVGVLLKFDKM